MHGQIAAKGRLSLID